MKSLIEVIEDGEVRERLISSLARVEAAESGVVEQDLSSAITQLAEDAAKEAEQLDIRAQVLCPC